MFTAEQRDKALATRMANKAARDAVKSNGNGSHDVPVIGTPWETMPMVEAMQTLSAMKREYDRAVQIIVKRQSVAKPHWTCWTQFHKDIVPRSVLNLCRKTGDDGKWASRDDGVFREEAGIRLPDPQFCCNAYCHEYYLKAKPMTSLGRR